MNVDRTLRLSLIYGAVVAVLIAVVGSVVGALVAELPGLIAGLLGAAVGFLFVAITAASLLLAIRLTRDDPASPLFFAVIMGAWLLKLVGFIAFVAIFRESESIDPIVLYVCLLAAAVGSVAVDVVAVLRSRIPYVDSAEPTAPADSSEAPPS